MIPEELVHKSWIACGYPAEDDLDCSNANYVVFFFLMNRLGPWLMSCVAREFVQTSRMKHSVDFPSDIECSDDDIVEPGKVPVPVDPNSDAEVPDEDEAPVENEDQESAASATTSSVAAGAAQSLDACSASSEDAVIEAAAPAEVDPATITWPKYLCGSRLVFENRLDKSGYARLIIACSHHPGEGCFKRRNTHVGQTHRFGACEPLGFLAVWHEMGAEEGLSRDDHVRDRNPTDAQVREWLQNKGYV